jgi:hypothetical protein
VRRIIGTGKLQVKPFHVIAAPMAAQHRFEAEAATAA